MYPTFQLGARERFTLIFDHEIAQRIPRTAPITYLRKNTTHTAYRTQHHVYTTTHAPPYNIQSKQSEWISIDPMPMPTQDEDGNWENALHWVMDIFHKINAHDNIVERAGLPMIKSELAFLISVLRQKRAFQEHIPAHTTFVCMAIIIKLLWPTFHSRCSSIYKSGAQVCICATTPLLKLEREIFFFMYKEDVMFPMLDGKTR